MRAGAPSCPQHRDRQSLAAETPRVTPLAEGRTLPTWSWQGMVTRRRWQELSAVSPCPCTATNSGQWPPAAAPPGLGQPKVPQLHKGMPA